MRSITSLTLCDGSVGLIPCSLLFCLSKCFCALLSNLEFLPMGLRSAIRLQQWVVRCLSANLSTFTSYSAHNSSKPLGGQYELRLFCQHDMFGSRLICIGVPRILPMSKGDFEQIAMYSFFIALKPVCMLSGRWLMLMLRREFPDVGSSTKYLRFTSSFSLINVL